MMKLLGAKKAPSFSKLTSRRIKFKVFAELLLRKTKYLKQSAHHTYFRRTWKTINQAREKDRV